jgi:hypothetical protein
VNRVRHLHESRGGDDPGVRLRPASEQPLLPLGDVAAVQDDEIAVPEDVEERLAVGRLSGWPPTRLRGSFESLSTQLLLSSGAGTVGCAVSRSGFAA